MEYCETHIAAHFGVYRKERSRKTGQIKSKLKFVGLVPPEHKNWGELYESYQVEKCASGHRSAPITALWVTAREESAGGMMLRLLTRHGIEDEEAFKPQPFSLIVTIADPEKKARVYDEMAQIVRNRFQSHNITVRTPARVRSGG